MVRDRLRQMKVVTNSRQYELRIELELSYPVQTKAAPAATMTDFREKAVSRPFYYRMQ